MNEKRAKHTRVLFLNPISGIAVKAGFMKETCENYLYTDTYLKMPELTPEEIRGLAKTFSLYRKVPKALYPAVALCEKEGKWRNRLFALLHKIFKSH